MVNESTLDQKPVSPWVKWIRRVSLTFAILFAILVPIARFAIYDMDHGTANAFTGILSLLALICIGGWFLLSSRLSWIARLGLLFVPIALVFGFINRYEFFGFSGEMIPQFRVRGSLPKVTSAPSLESQPNGDSPATTGDREVTSFQFLGNGRDGLVSGVRIKKNWKESSPRIAWRVPVGAGWSGMAIADGRVITLEQRDEEEWVTCYDLGNGKLLWSHTDPGRHYDVLGGLGPRSTPTIQGDRVYTLGATGILNCLSVKDGGKLWSKDLLTVSEVSLDAFQELVKWGRAASPLLVDNSVIVPLGGLKKSNRSLAAFDKQNGELQWREGDDQISYVSPMEVRLLDRDYFLIVNENTVALHQKIDGKTAWTYPWAGQSNGPASCTQPIVVDGNRMLISKGYGGGSVYLELSIGEGNALQSREIWKNAGSLRTKFSNPLLFDGHIYGLSDGVLECVRLEDGKRAWKSGRFGHGQMLLVGDQLLISSEEGDLVLVDASPKKLTENARMHVLDGVTWNIPSLAGKWLLMRNGSELVCLELPLE